jgi:hypothetical protein
VRVMTIAKQSKTYGSVTIYNSDVLSLYDEWESPTVIISDGPYGLANFQGDLKTPEELPDWYEPHVKAWSKKATGQTTLWFWNSEVGWATLHPLLKKYDWKYVTCHIWDKGIGHIAGNANVKTLRKFPVVTEVCVQYSKNVRVDGLLLKDWLRHEWERSGLPLSKANEASGVDNAATRKYFTKDYLWYFPPREAFVRFAEYVNKHGKKEGKPYFAINGKIPSGEEWARLRSKFHCKMGVTNVWREAPVNGKERVKTGSKSTHLNQKPLRLMELLVEASSEVDDLVWEPFGGLCTGAVAAYKLKRRCLAAEINKRFYKLATERLKVINAQRALPSMFVTA